MAVKIICATCDKPKLIQRAKLKSINYCSHSCYWKSKVGKQPWIDTPETRKSRSIAARNRHYSEAARERYSLAHQDCSCHHGTDGGQNKGKHWRMSEKALAERDELFATGQIVSPFKGKKHSIDSLQKLSLSLRGKLAGSKNPNWKGGIGPERRRAMGRWDYIAWRKAVFERDDYACQGCGAANTYFHADHVVNWADDASLRYEVSNGITLCYRCHFKKTFGYVNEEKAVRWGIPKKYRRILV